MPEPLPELLQMGRVAPTLNHEEVVTASRRTPIELHAHEIGQIHPHGQSPQTEAVVIHGRNTSDGFTQRHDHSGAAWRRPQGTLRSRVAQEAVVSLEQHTAVWGRCRAPPPERYGVYATVKPG